MNRVNRRREKWTSENACDKSITVFIFRSLLTTLIEEVQREQEAWFKQVEVMERLVKQAGTRLKPLFFFNDFFRDAGSEQNRIGTIASTV